MVLVLLVLVLVANGVGEPLPRQESDVCVVANLSDDVGEVDVELVRGLFLERQRFWPDGSAAHPVNLPAASGLRETFSQIVFGESVADMVPYWNDRYFHGTRPPPAVASEEAVLLFVARTSGGIGYVSGPTDLPDGVRELFCLPAPDG